MRFPMLAVIVSLCLMAAASSVGAQPPPPDSPSVGSGPDAGHDAHAHHKMMAAAPQTGDRPVARALGGLSIPDVPVLDQEGRERRFFSDLVDGKTVAINFIFTTCTTICPPMGANFGRLQRDLGARAGTDVHLISVSVDPVTDTPERLAAWRDKFGDREGWTLVTGERSEITRLLKALEVFTADVTEHSPVVILGHEPTGRWTRAYGLAPPAKLAQILADTGGAESLAAAEGAP